MNLDMFMEFCNATLNSAHDSPNAKSVGHRDGFCLACAEIYVSLHIGYGWYKENKDETQDSDI